MSVIILFTAAVVNCEDDLNEADPTIVLNDDNFEESLKENSSFFVMFYGKIIHAPIDFTYHTI